MTKDGIQRPDGAESIETLLAVMARLRDPQGGCPWDREQDFTSIAPYTIEEAYEVADAISRGDMEGLVDELGDLLFQVVFHAQMAKEAGEFEFKDVVFAVVDKMVRRHPHVFGDNRIETAEAQTRSWEAHKAAEREQKDSGPSSLMDHVPEGLPALKRAQKLQQRATIAGFDWPDARGVPPKIREELSELMDAVDAGAPALTLQEEMGDLLFSCINLARHLNIDAEMSLRRANTKFERRFRWLETELSRRGSSAEQADSDMLEAVWSKAKQQAD